MTSDAPSPLQIIDLLSTPMTPEDLDFELDNESEEVMKEFDAAWKKFLEDNPQLVPEGKREQNIIKLQQQVQDLQNSQKEVNEELQKQLEFFDKSRETMEEGFTKDLEAAKQKEEKIKAKFHKQLESVSSSEYILSQTIPWESFIKAAEKCGEDKYRGKKDEFSFFSHFQKPPVVENNDKKVKPSARAMALVDDTEGEIRDIQLRAYQIDHALLNTQIKMLQMEAEGYEKYLESQKAVAKFLNDQNIFTIVTNEPEETEGV